MCKCVTGAVCVAHRDRRGLWCCRAQSRCATGCRAATSSCGVTHSPASSSRVARPLRPRGAGRGAARWLDKRCPAKPQQSPALEG